MADGTTQTGIPENQIPETEIEGQQPEAPKEQKEPEGTTVQDSPKIPEGAFVIDGVIMDPVTGDVIGEIPEEPSKPDDTLPTEPEKEPSGKDVHPEGEKPKYTDEELRTLDWQELDTSRLPESAVPIYKSLQASYTRKSQEVSETTKRLEKERAELDRILEQAKGIPQGQQGQQPVTKAQQYQELNAIIVTKVAQELGIAPDEVDLYDPTHRLAYDDIRANLQRSYNDHRQQEMAQTQQKQFLGRVEQEIRAFEPNYDDIVTYSQEWFSDLKVSEMDSIKADIAKAVQTQDPKPIKALSERIRKSYYAKKKGFGKPFKEGEPSPQGSNTPKQPTAQPPSVTQPGGEKPDVKPTPFDAKQLRGLSTDEVAKKLEELGLGDI